MRYPFRVSGANTLAGFWRGVFVTAPEAFERARIHVVSLKVGSINT